MLTAKCFSLAFNHELNFITICPVKPNCSVRTHGQKDKRTDMTKLVLVFRKFRNTPKFKFIGNIFQAVNWILSIVYVFVNKQELSVSINRIILSS